MAEEKRSVVSRVGEKDENSERRQELVEEKENVGRPEASIKEVDALRRYV